MSNQHRLRLLEKYILAIHQHKDDWDRFPELEEYYQAVECKWQVEIEMDDDED